MSLAAETHSHDIDCGDVVALWATIYSELSQKLMI